ncbi:MAG: nitroreductase/quinone reductase family protein [Candidatus Nanopelagicales bacterium]
MSEVNDWNAAIIAEFRANGGKVGGQFEGAPVVLMHHVGRKSGKESVNPVMYLADDSDPATIFVFASKGGAPTHPDWYWNMTEAGRATIEVGTETYDVTVRELEGEERDSVYAEQASRYPGFAEYAEKTAGIRVIPVLALTRA